MTALTCFARTATGERDRQTASEFVSEGRVNPEQQTDQIPSPDLPTNDPPLSSAPQAAVREIWLEVLAVLAIGVLPSLISAIAHYADHPAPPSPYWLDSLDLCLRSACISFAVLYLIHRSGEPFAFFGIARPRHSDLWFGLCLYLIAVFLYRNVWPLMPADGVKLDAIYSVPQTRMDYLLMVPRYAANGFAEELVHAPISSLAPRTAAPFAPAPSCSPPPVSPPITFTQASARCFSCFSLGSPTGACIYCSAESGPSR